MRKLLSFILTLSLLLCLTAALGACAPENTPAWKEKGDAETQDGSDPAYFDYLGHPIEVAAGVAPNPYASEAFSLEDGILSYSAAETRFGIDVSSHQDDVDWAAVKADGVEFVMIRVGYRGSTEGRLYVDNRFYEYMDSAAAAGLDIGIYFFSQATSLAEAREEAEQVVDWLGGYDIRYPVVYDWERSHDDGSRTLGVTGDVVTECCAAFCARMREAGYTPMVYFNLDLAYMYYDLSALDGVDFWLAEYEQAPTFRYDFQMLQYSAYGDVDGIDGDVDLNLCFKAY